MPGDRQQNKNNMQKFDSMVYYMEHGGDVLDCAKQICKSCEDYPFIIITVKDGRPENFYAAGSNTIYPHQSLVGSLNSIFMTYLVYILKYQPSNYNVLIFLQNFMFKIHLNADKKIRSVIKFITALDAERLNDA